MSGRFVLPVLRILISPIGALLEPAALALCHTFREISDGSATVRIFSARKATRRETKEYEKRKP